MTDPDPPEVGDEDPGRPRTPRPARSGETRDYLLLAGRVRVVEERIDAYDAAGAAAATVDDLVKLQQVVGELKAAVDKLRAAADEAPEPFDWDDLDAEARAHREEQVRAWVADWLAVWHPDEHAKLKCWWEHRPARDVVKDAWLAWCGANRADTRRHADPLEWVTRWLPAMSKVVVAAVGDELEPCKEHGRTRRAA